MEWILMVFFNSFVITLDTFKTYNECMEVKQKLAGVDLFSQLPVWCENSNVTKI